MSSSNRNRETSQPILGHSCSHRNANCLSEKLSRTPNTYVIHQTFNDFTDFIGSVFVVITEMIIGEIAFISAILDVGVSCSSTFVFRGILYDVVHRRHE